MCSTARIGRGPAWALLALTAGIAVAGTGGCGATAEPAATPPPAPREAVSGCERRHPGVGPTRFETSRRGSSVVLAGSATELVAYVADGDDDSIHVVDVMSQRRRATVAVGGEPAQILVLADGRVAVTLRDENRVEILEPTADAGLTSICSAQTPAEPIGLAATPDDATLLVTSGFAHTLTGFDAATLTPRFHRDVPREPRDVVVADDGSRALVAHVVGGRVSIVDLQADHADGDRVRAIDVTVPRSAAAPDAGSRRSCQGFALAKTVAVAPHAFAATETPDQLFDLAPTLASTLPRGRIFAPRVTIDPGDPERRSSGYGSRRNQRIEVPIVSVIDVDAERTLTSALMPDLEAGGRAPRGECLLPRSAHVAGDSLYVACMGSDILLELDPRGVDPARLERNRFPLPAGPTGFAIAGRTAIAMSQFDRVVSLVDLRGKTPTKSLALPPPRKAKLSAAARRGRTLFHRTDDRRISADGRACASCHPDGREDALTWSTPVGPRQTIMLAGRVQGSAPYSWLGRHADLEAHLHSTFERLDGSGMPPRNPRASDRDRADLEALLAYLEEMPGPNLDDAWLPPAKRALLARGETLFNADAQGCARCHQSGGSDSAQHDLGTRTAADLDDAFDTPSLRFVGGTAPYFHDGRYASLIDLLRATDAEMGHTMHLSRRDAEALAAYLETL